MTVLSESIAIARPPEALFDYVADFRHTVEWDSTAQAARKLTAGPVAEGTRFMVNCALPLGSLDIEYQITRLNPPHCVELQGKSRWFDITDRIELHHTALGTQLDYRAEFHFSRPLRALAARLSPGLERMGKASIDGLQQALADQNPPPDSQVRHYSLARRLKNFTRLGYQQAQQHWLPRSARLDGRHIIISGATSGIGKAAALELAERGASITVVARDRTKAEQACREIGAETGNSKLRIEIADLCLMSEVDALCKRLRYRAEPIDALINNAGALFNDYRLTEEGFERSLALLLLSPCRLTLGLKSLLQSTDAGTARVINVLSGGMYTRPLSLTTLTRCEPQQYNGPVAYALAKRALMLVTEHWAEQWRDDDIAVNAMHPGWVDTPGLTQALPGFHRGLRYVLRSPEQGADTIVWLAAATETAALSGGLFLDREAQPLYLRDSTRESDDERRELIGYLQRQQKRPAAQ